MAAAPVAAAALVKACLIGAVVGVVFDLAFQVGMHLWRHGTFEGFVVDGCSLILAAVLGCVGQVLLARFVGPWLTKQLGGVGGPLVGRILAWLASRAGIGIPRALVKFLMKLGCVDNEQAELIAPGVTSEATAGMPRSPSAQSATALAGTLDGAGEAAV